MTNTGRQFLANPHIMISVFIDFPNVLLDLCQHFGIGVNSNDRAIAVKQEGVESAIQAPTLDDAFLSIYRGAELRCLVQIVQFHNGVEHTGTAVQVHRYMGIVRSRQSGKTVILLID